VREHRGALLTGIGVALAVAVQPTLVAQVLDSRYEDLSATVTYPVAALVFVGMALGGLAAAGRAPDQKVLVAALAGLVATIVVQGLGILRRSAADNDVAWSSVPVVALVSVACASGAAALAARRAGRTRP
jgi:hypothetical protein